MKNLPNLDIKDIDIDRSKYFSQGYESVIFGSYKNSLVKLFRDDLERDSIGTMLQNKFEKICSLYDANLSYLIQPLYTVSSDGNFIGYGMEYDPKAVPSSSVSMKRRETIEFLKKTSEILKYFGDNDITYGDVMDRNILIGEDNSIKFCDIDNIRFGNNQIDNMNGCFRYFLTHGGLEDSGDAFMHNLFTLRQLYYPDSHLSTVLNHVVDCDLKHTFNKKVKRVTDEMSQPNYFEGDYVIQYIKR